MRRIKARRRLRYTPEPSGFYFGSIGQRFTTSKLRSVGSVQLDRGREMGAILEVFFYYFIIIFDFFFFLVQDCLNLMLVGKGFFA